MKNIVIIVLIIVVAGLGLLYADKNTSENNTKPSSNSTKVIEQNSGNTLDLSNKGLNKISSDLLDDSSVTYLAVNNNNLTGALPAEIRKLTNLETLNASNNKMTGIPAEIGQLSKLRVANFANNNISGLPLEIGNLQNLETLDLRGNPNISRHDISLIQPKIPSAKILVDE